MASVLTPTTPITQTSAQPLSRGFYARPTVVVARELLGCTLRHRAERGDVAGIIVEAEAYGPDDPASHAYPGLRERNAVMFGPPGHAYVYRSYGVHWCFNVVTAAEGIGEAILIRALEPSCGIEMMEQNRGLTDRRLLCAGPGRLTEALGITGAHSGVDLTGESLFILEGIVLDERVIATQRIGITRAIERPWRFCVSGSRFVSRKRPPLNPQPICHP